MSENIVNTAVGRRVIDETLAFLEASGNASIAGFIQRVNRGGNVKLLVGGGNKLLINQIKEHLGKSISQQDLLDYADTLRERSSQHLFLYKLGNQDAGILTELRSQSHIRRLLATRDLSDCYNKPQMILDAPKPKLAFVKHTEGPRAILMFKWVETRTWKRITIHRGNADLPPVVQSLKERSVNFFRLHLETGECELSIQRLNPNPSLTLQEEHDYYLDLAKKILGIDQLHRVNLEPVIKHLMDSKEIKISSWKVAFERGGYLKGARDPNLAQRINLFLTPFIGLELKNTWVNENYAGAFTSFDAKNDEVFLHNHFADESEMVYVLNRIRQYSEIKFHNPMLRELSLRHERLEPALYVIDMVISRSGKDSIDCRKLADDHWVPQADMLEAVETVRLADIDELHNLFQIKYLVICPDTHKPVFDENDEPIEFYARKDVPNKIACRHSYPKEIKKHPTNGNIKPIIHILPVPRFWDMGMLGVAERARGLLSFIQKHFGKKLGLNMLKITLGAIYSVPFFLIAYLIFNVMLTSAALFPDQSDAIKFAYTMMTLVLVLLLFIFLITLFGAKTMKQALDALGQFVKTALRSIFHKSPRQDKYQKRHKGRTNGKSARLAKLSHTAQSKRH